MVDADLKIRDADLRNSYGENLGIPIPGRS